MPMPITGSFTLHAFVHLLWYLVTKISCRDKRTHGKFEVSVSVPELVHLSKLFKYNYLFWIGTSTLQLRVCLLDHKPQNTSSRQYQHYHQQQQQQHEECHEDSQRDAVTLPRSKKELWSPGHELEQHNKLSGKAYKSVPGEPKKIPPTTFVDITACLLYTSDAADE